MAVPDFQTLMLPVLKQFADGKEKTPADVRGPVAVEFGLTTNGLATLLPSGRRTTFSNRVAWALGYLKQSSLLESLRRGHYQLTGRGREILLSPPERIDISFLERYANFQAFKNRGGATPDPALAKSLPESHPRSFDVPLLAPDERIRAGAARIRENLAAQLLERVKRGSSAAFRQLVVDLSVAMGYGGSHEMQQRLSSGDGGIDGIIKEDRLELESIYVQASVGKGPLDGPEFSSSPVCCKGIEREKVFFLQRPISLARRSTTQEVCRPRSCSSTACNWQTS
jgi:restriction system protein